MATDAADVKECFDEVRRVVLIVATVVAVTLSATASDTLQQAKAQLEGIKLVLSQRETTMVKIGDRLDDELLVRDQNGSWHSGRNQREVFEVSEGTTSHAVVVGVKRAWVATLPADPGKEDTLQSLAGAVFLEPIDIRTFKYLWDTLPKRILPVRIGTGTGIQCVGNDNLVRGVSFKRARTADAREVPSYEIVPSLENGRVRFQLQRLGDATNEKGKIDLSSCTIDGLIGTVDGMGDASQSSHPIRSALRASARLTESVSLQDFSFAFEELRRTFPEDLLCTAKIDTLQAEMNLRSQRNTSVSVLGLTLTLTQFTVLAPLLILGLQFILRSSLSALSDAIRSAVNTDLPVLVRTYVDDPFLLWGVVFVALVMPLLGFVTVWTFANIQAKPREIIASMASFGQALTSASPLAIVEVLIFSLVSLVLGLHCYQHLISLGVCDQVREVVTLNGLSQDLDKKE